MGWFSRVCILSACALVLAQATNTAVQAQEVEPVPPPVAAVEAPPPTAASAQPEAAASPEAPRQSWREMKDSLPDEIIKPPPPERRWYGWETLIADVTGLALIALSFDGDSSAGYALGGLAILTFASPIVHLGNSNSQAAGISLAIRLSSFGLLALGIVAIASSIDDSFDDGPSNGFSPALGVVSLILSVTGAAAAVIIDASLLAFKEKPAKARGSAVDVAPLLDPVRGSYGLRFGLKL